ncbi:MAG: hypothetical protein WC617_19280 [Rhodanobacter sp.]|jgi:hypothetical protein
MFLLLLNSQAIRPTKTWWNQLDSFAQRASPIYGDNDLLELQASRKTLSTAILHKKDVARFASTEKHEFV